MPPMQYTLLPIEQTALPANDAGHGKRCLPFGTVEEIVSMNYENRRLTCPTACTPPTAINWFPLATFQNRIGAN